MGFQRDSKIPKANLKIKPFTNIRIYLINRDGLVVTLFLAEFRARCRHFRARSRPNQEIEMSNQPNREKEESQSSRKNSHILIIDDVEITESSRQALIATGYSVSVALDGNQELAYTEATSPDLLFLDIMMPRRSEFLVLERLRQNDNSPIPILMITGNEGSQHREYAEMLGVNDYLNKPLTMDRLLNSISDLLKEQIANAFFQVGDRGRHDLRVA